MSKGIKLIIAGSRTISINYSIIAKILDSHLGICLPENSGIMSIDLVISGGAKGIDECAKAFALNYRLPHLEVKANWEQFGKAAGPIRNRFMAKEGDALLLIWYGNSKGSANMKQEMKKQGKPVWEYVMTDPKNLGQFPNLMGLLPVIEK